MGEGDINIAFLVEPGMQIGVGKLGDNWAGVGVILHWGIGKLDFP
jgi:hypothetical protein